MPSFRNTLRLGAGLILAASGIVAHAMDAALSADAGTLGAGLHLSLPLTQSVNARLGFGLFNYSRSVSTNNINYDAKLKLQNLDILADWFPFDNGFRLTGGAVLNFNKVDANARPRSGTYTVNGVTYNASQAGNIDGRIDFRKLAPYLGIGYGNALARNGNWGVTADLGVMFQGSPSSSLTSNNCTAGAAICGSLQQNLQAENQSLRDKIDYRFWPVVRVGVYYRF